MNIPANIEIGLCYYNVSNKLYQLITEHENVLLALTKSNTIEEKDFARNEGMVQVMFNDGLIYLSLKGIIDFKAEVGRLQKNLEKVDLEIQKIDRKLENKSFVENAPKDIMQEQINRKEEYISSRIKIEKAIKSLK